MPIYDYECIECKKEYECFHSIDGEAPRCKCGGEMVKKPSSPAIIRVLGSGKYPRRSEGYKRDYSKDYLKSIQTQDEES